MNLDLISELPWSSRSVCVTCFLDLLSVHLKSKPWMRKTFRITDMRQHSIDVVAMNQKQDWRYKHCVQWNLFEVCAIFSLTAIRAFIVVEDGNMYTSKILTSIRSLDQLITRFNNDGLHQWRLNLVFGMINSTGKLAL